MNIKFLNILFVCLLIIFIPLFSYKIIVNNYDYNIEQKNVVDYVLNKGDLNLEGFEQNEIDHLLDVRNVIRSVDLVFDLVVILLVLLSVYLYRNGRFDWIIYAGLLGICMGLILILFTYLDFFSMFDNFHKLFFTPGSWIFSSQSKIIQLFPITFFIATAKKIFILSLILNIMIVITGFVKKWQE